MKLNCACLAHNPVGGRKCYLLLNVNRQSTVAAVCLLYEKCVVYVCVCVFVRVCVSEFQFSFFDVSCKKPFSGFVLFGVRSCVLFL